MYTRANFKRLFFTVAPVVAAVAVVSAIERWRNDREETAYADDAAASVLDQAGPGSRLVSIHVDRPGQACGWVDLGGGKGLSPFRVDGQPISLVTVPHRRQGDLGEQISALYEQQLVLVMCDMPRPAGADIDERREEPLADMIRFRQPWAIIPAPSGDGFVAVRRSIGGGLVISPRVGSASEAQAWTAGEGRRLAAAGDAAGKLAMARTDCIADAKDNAARQRC